MQLTVKTITEALKQLDYPLFKGDYNLNLIGIRSSDKDANTFNDVLVVMYQLDGKWLMHTFPMTTDPGVFYREHPINVTGTAIVAPGHHARCWQIGAHQGKYQALVQRGEMQVYRDTDQDAELDFDTASLQMAMGGFNLHHAKENGISLQVDKWSAGCQVLANSLDFDLVMALAKKSASLYGKWFSYTLLTEEQL